MALVCLCRGNFYWPPHTTILFCSIFLDKIVLDTLKSRYHRSAPLGIAYQYVIIYFGEVIFMYCKNCGTMLNDNQEFCANCGVKAGGGGRFCQNCGGELMPGANVCEKCGAPVNNPETPPVTPPPANGQQNGAVSGEYLNGKDKTTMAIICFLLGGLGIHNFMMGENKKGIVKIVASLCFGVGYILAIIDFVKILTGSYVVDPEKLF